MGQEHLAGCGMVIKTQVHWELGDPAGDSVSGRDTCQDMNNRHQHGTTAKYGLSKDDNIRVTHRQAKFQDFGSITSRLN